MSGQFTPSIRRHVFLAVRIRCTARVGSQRKEGIKWQATFVHDALKSNAAGIHVQYRRHEKRREKGKKGVEVDR